MFSGEESIRFTTSLSGPALEAEIDKNFDVIGPVHFRGRGAFTVSAAAYETSWVRVRIEGQLTRCKRDGKWMTTVTVSAQPSAASWTVVAIFGIALCVLFPLGAISFLLLLLPQSAVSNLRPLVRALLFELREDVEA
jgi:hypothetical protein